MGQVFGETRLIWEIGLKYALNPIRISVEPVRVSHVDRVSTVKAKRHNPVAVAFVAQYLRRSLEEVPSR
ncbi:MAG: hypothetical protein IIC96_19925 [Chloroflexi bacterium]|nr:hypothetical protein [Chloroflexota bacterium]